MRPPEEHPPSLRCAWLTVLLPLALSMAFLRPRLDWGLASAPQGTLLTQSYEPDAHKIVEGPLTWPRLLTPHDARYPSN